MTQQHYQTQQHSKYNSSSVSTSELNTLEYPLSMKQKMRLLLNKYGQTQKDLADILGLTYQSVSIKLNGHKDFTQSEIFTIMVMYELTPDEVVDIFFQRTPRKPSTQPKSTYSTKIETEEPELLYS
jgi:DNA-binding XRE family transcriptional regulator